MTCRLGDKCRCVSEPQLCPEWSVAACCDCGLPYADPGFADLVVTAEVWGVLSPSGGLLCPTCMVRAAAKAGLTGIWAEFRSGPFANIRYDRDTLIAGITDENRHPETLT